ncbi:MAG: HAD hydrolase-like protein [Planctomycetota bacterium]
MAVATEKTLGGAIFDLDGTVTQTAPLRKAVWKSVLDPIVREEAQRLGKKARPFDIRRDYREHFDGRLRPEAVQSFLATRQIPMPMGEPTDGAGSRTIHGLCARKAEMLSQMIEERGLAIFEDSLELMKALAKDGVPIAVVSPSTDAAGLIERIGATSIVTAIVDGHLAREKSLRGKPEPDLFREAARALGREPADRAVFDWSPLGMKAARAGDMGLAVGIDRGGAWIGLRQAGADRVVHEMGELTIASVRAWQRGARDVPPPAVLHWTDIRQRLAGRGLAVFLDAERQWLRPVLERPGRVEVSEPIQAAIRRFAEKGTIVVVGERRSERLTELLECDEALVAGSGGLEVRSGGEIALQMEELSGIESRVGEAVRQLRERLPEDEALVIEHRGASVLIEHRFEMQRAEIEEALEKMEIAERIDHPLAIEIWPTKVPGRAAFGELLASSLDFEGAPAGFVAFSSSEKGEAIFDALPDDALKIAILDEPRASRADYSAQGEEEIQKLLELLAAAM